MKKLVLLLLLATGCDYSDGTRVGLVTKISKKGMIFKSYEGDLKIGGANLLNPEHWAFSVESDSVAKALELASRRAASVELEYKQCFPVMKYDTNYFITAVKFLDANGNVTSEVR